MIVRLTVRLAILAAVATLLCGCAASLGSRTFATWETWSQSVAGPVEVAFHGIPVRSGQIIASEQGSPQSVLLTLMLSRSYRYVHTGLIVVENGEPFVYEANGRPSIFLWGKPPTDRVQGEVRRLTLEDFIRHQRFIAIYEPPPGVDTGRAVAYAQSAYATSLPFDPYFDYRDPSKVYCNEFVALALEAGGAAAPATVPMSSNASIRVVNDWLKVTAPAMFTGESVFAGGRQVALLSRTDTPDQITGYFAFKAELHRRFTPDQKVGNVFSFSGYSGLQFRAEVREFMNAVNHEAAGWRGTTDEEADARVRQIAAQMLGPFETSPFRQADGAPRSISKQAGAPSAAELPTPRPRS